MAAGPGMIEAIHQALRQGPATQILALALASFLEGRGLAADTTISIRVTAAEIVIGEGTVLPATAVPEPAPPG